MIACAPGFVSKVEKRVDKQKGLLRVVHIASGESMMQIVLKDSDPDFRAKDDVMVYGEVASFERRLYMKGGVVRALTDADRTLFAVAQAIADAMGVQSVTVPKTEGK